MMTLFKVLRVKQWVKNAFIFFPLIFSGSLFRVYDLRQSFLTFVGFCFIASSMYVLNDLLDLKRDQIHPQKAKRTEVKFYRNVGLVTFFILFLLGAGTWILSYVNPLVIMAGAGYVVLHLLYNLIVKRIVILDVIFIAIGFHLRILAGALAIAVLPSVWLQLCVFILALFLGFTKRRHEMHTLKEIAKDHRVVLTHYTPYLLDQMIIICSTLAVVFYGLYTISPEIVARRGNFNMTYSLVFVIYGMFRYLYLIHVKNLGNDPGEILLSDWPLMVNVLAWIIFVGFLIY
jgi:4-hydroxybenzoate polyprenyltransferase